MDKILCTCTSLAEPDSRGGGGGGGESGSARLHVHKACAMTVKRLYKHVRYSNSVRWSARQMYYFLPVVKLGGLALAYPIILVQFIPPHTQIVQNVLCKMCYAKKASWVGLA